MARDHRERAGPVRRRRLLQGVGAACLVGIAGCLDEESDPIDPADALQRERVDVADIEEGGTLRVAQRVNPSSFDPAYSLEAPAWMAQNLLFESLITTTVDGAVRPWVARDYDLEAVNDIDRLAYEDYMVSLPQTDGLPDADAQVVVSHPDNDPAAEEGQYLTVEETADAVADGTFGMRFRYDLHETVTFHDGTALTADHVVQSYERYENSPLAGQTFNQFLHAEAVDDHTVDLYAQVPDAGAERDLPVQIIHPDQYDLPGGALDPRQGTDPIGTGPWVFETFEDESHLVVHRNDDYWLDLADVPWWDGPADFPDRPPIERVDVEFVSDDSIRASALENGEVDLTHGLVAEARSNFARDDGFRVTAAPGGGFSFMQYPVAVEPWDDPRVRRAANHLVPRVEIVESIYDGWAEPAWTPLPEVAARDGTTDYEQLTEELRPYNEYDRERAAELLEDAGVETPVEATLVTHTESDDRISAVQLIVQAMNESGLFEASLETPGDLSQVVGLFMSPEFADAGEIAVISISGTFNPDSFARAVHHPDQIGDCCNFTGIENPSLTEAIDDALFGVDVSQDATLRRERYDALWERILEYSANSFIEFEHTTASLADGVRGFNAYPFEERLLSYGLYAPEDRQVTYLEQ